MCIVKNTFPERGLNVPCLPRDYSDGAWIMRIFILKRNFNPAVLRKPFIPMEVKKVWLRDVALKKFSLLKKKENERTVYFMQKILKM